MILLPDKKAVLVAPKVPERLLKIIPTSRAVTYEGRRMVAVPHRLDETIVLNNLGVRTPSPMLRTYDWPRRGEIVNPFEAQKETAGFLTLNTRAFVLNDLGTGKSLSALWAYDYLRKLGRASKLLVVCPLSTMERTWADEIFFNLPHLKYQVLHGTRPQRLKLLALDADVYIINHHGVKIVLEELVKRKDIDSVVVDELASAAMNKHAMWRSLNVLINGQVKRRAWGMTGTPTPNEPTDAYWQTKLINPKQATMYYTAFRRLCMNQVSQFRWVPRDDAVDKVDELMRPAIRFRRDQCVDLPPTIYMTRECPLTKEAQEAYDTMHKILCAQVENNEILAVNEAVKASKLVQIACGVVYDQDKNEITVDAGPRLALTLDMVKESSSKSIVFVPFRSSIKLVADYLAKAGYSVGVIHGGVSKSDRDEIFSGFQKGTKYNVIVAQPGAMSHGLTLTDASSIIWYAPITSPTIYEQANGRITRPGQKFTTCIIHIEGTAVERRIFARLKNKQKMQNLLLERKVFRTAA